MQNVFSDRIALLDADEEIAEKDLRVTILTPNESYHMHRMYLLSFKFYEKKQDERISLLEID